ncbi:uncharacterized protein [Prorops nasuta]|uniref:uncharacterized protein n=1 Tax=Prorops nasuta TaxID=863751 RepID=UPI0034CD3394
MYAKGRCKEYREAKKLRLAKKKPKREFDDDDSEISNEESQVRNAASKRRLPKRKKKFEKKVKPLSRTEMILKAIRPSIETRQRVDDSIHDSCFLEFSEVARIIKPLTKASGPLNEALARFTNQSEVSIDARKTDDVNSDCSSICSFDSEVSLTAAALDSEDERKLTRQREKKANDVKKKEEAEEIS